MDVKTLIQAAVPTPFGWVIQTEEDFELHAKIAFQGQLLSLAEVCGPIVAATDMTGLHTTAKQAMTEEVGVLVPLKTHLEQRSI